MVDGRPDHVAPDGPSEPASEPAAAVQGTPGHAADESAAAGGHLCPWCSAELGDEAPDRCPSCGAGLAGDPEASVPGVTVLDPETARLAERRPAPPKRRFFGLLVDAGPGPQESGIQPSSTEALAPPSAAVRREMQRLRAELEAAAAAEREQAAALDGGSQVDAAAAAGPADLAEGDPGDSEQATPS